MNLSWLVLLAWCGMSKAESDWSQTCAPVCKCKWVSGKKVAECSDQALTSVPSHLSPEIQTIDLSNNTLTSLPSKAFQAVGLVNLQKIFLRECGIQELDKDAFKDLPILIELDLSNNKIYSIHPLSFRDNVRLRYIHMTHNPITKLENGLFTNKSFLQMVDMSNCHLEHIEDQTFMNVPALQHLILNGNKFMHMEVSVLEPLDRLTSLYLHDNPWKCDCHLRALRDWTISKNVFDQQPTCAEPPHLVLQWWSEIDPYDFACKPQIVYPPSDNVSITFDEEVTLSCKAIGNPPPEVYWVINARIISKYTNSSDGDSKHTLREGDGWANLSISSDLRMQDRREVACIAKSRGDFDERIFNLTEPSNTTETESGNLNVNQTLSSNGTESEAGNLNVNQTLPSNTTETEAGNLNVNQPLLFNTTETESGNLNVNQTLPSNSTETELGNLNVNQTLPSNSTETELGNLNVNQTLSSNATETESG